MTRAEVLTPRVGQELGGETVANLLIIAGALFVAFRMTAPALRMAIRVVEMLIGLTLFIAVAILCVIALLTHGALI